jgi:hypothetical protein
VEVLAYRAELGDAGGPSGGLSLVGPVPVILEA